MTDIISQLVQNTTFLLMTQHRDSSDYFLCFSAKYRKLLMHSISHKRYFVQYVPFYKPPQCESSPDFQTCTSQCSSSCLAHIHYLKVVPKYHCISRSGAWLCDTKSALTLNWVSVSALLVVL